MKRVLKKDSSQLNINVEVEFNVVVDDADIAASEVISALKEYIDEQALSDYKAFVLQTRIQIEDHDLILLEKDESQSSATSKYYVIADLNQHVLGTMKYVIYLRLSNHVADPDEDVKQWIDNRRKYYAEKYNVKWKLRSVIVNDQIFRTYDEASDYIEERCIQWKKDLNSND